MPELRHFLLLKNEKIIIFFKKVVDFKTEMC